MEIIEEMQEFVKKIANNEHETVKPGQPVRFTEACTEGDRIWQGDLALTIIKKIPNDYKLADNPSNQLVVGNTEGARHCLDSLDGVALYLPNNWNEESLQGPVLVLNQERTVLHPTHGNVTIPTGFTVHCTYQREWDKEQERERRARD